MSSGSGHRRRSGLPEQEMAVGLEAIRRRSRGPCPESPRPGSAASRARAQPQRSTSTLAWCTSRGAARQDLDRAHVPRFRDGHRQHEDCGSDRRPPQSSDEAGRRRQHEIGRAELPASGERGRRGRVGAGRPSGARLDPAASVAISLIGQPPLADEVAVPRDGRPWRHVARPVTSTICRAPALHLRVRRQREGTGAALVMARRALRVDDWRHVTANVGRLVSGASTRGRPSGRGHDSCRPRAAHALLRVRDHATYRLRNSRRAARDPAKESSSASSRSRLVGRGRGRHIDVPVVDAAAVHQPAPAHRGRRRRPRAFASLPSS